MDNSIIEKLTKAASAEDLQSIAKKCGLDKISLDDAKKLFDQLKNKGGISMDSLKSVLGDSGALKTVLGAVENAGKSGGKGSADAEKKTEVKEAADALKDALGKFKK